MEKKKRTTLIELAASCGLSKTAVGAILNHDPKYQVLPETRAKVLAQAAKMNYRPNLVAKALVSRKYYTVGMLFYSAKDRCYSEIMSAAQQALASHGYACIFAFWENTGFMEAYNILADHGVDGIITNASDSMVQQLPEEMPVVLYGCSSSRRDAVLVERGTAIREALEYLYQLGHRKFGYLCNPHPELRYQAFVDFHHDKGLPLHEEWLCFSGTMLNEKEEGMLQLLAGEDHPTAVIAQNDVGAMAAMATAVKAGYRVPEDISFVGFDNILESAYTIPALTTLDIQFTETAYELVELLVKRMEDPGHSQMVHKIVPRFIIRKSCSEVIE